MFIWRCINTVTYFAYSSVNLIRSVILEYCFITVVWYFLYIYEVFCISMQFSNTVVTVRNKSRKALKYLIHCCSSSRYVIWQAFCTVLAIHIYYNFLLCSIQNTSSKFVKGCCIVINCRCLPRIFLAENWLFDFFKNNIYSEKNSANKYIFNVNKRHTRANRELF